MTRLACLTLFMLLVLLAACATVYAEPKEKLVNTKRAEHKELHDIYFAGGCFWGVEEYFSRIPGVVDATAGYANGHTDHPDYASVCSGLTGHAETVHVRYDPQKVSLSTLVRQFFKIIDPLSINRQGNDIGTQYRTGIYYSDGSDKAELELLMAEEQARHTKTLAVELMPLKKYWLAENYHQDYLKKHPGGYCHIDFCTLKSLPSSPAETEHEDVRNAAPENSLSPARYRKPSDAELRKMLSPEEYDVTQHAGTERAFTGKFWDHKEEGIYVDIATGEPLFSSADKFDSGCGWPSFSQPIDENVMRAQLDTSYGMRRVEVRSRVGDSHLGHVFNDGPKELGGLRFCINSAALRFIPYEDMEKAGYGDLMPKVRNQSTPLDFTKRTL